jgi:hypothetical protein
MEEIAFEGVCIRGGILETQLEFRLQCASTEVICFTYIEKLLVEWKLRWTFELKNKSSEPTNLGLAVFRHKPHFPRDHRVNGKKIFQVWSF